jgi:hypothetical protein
MDESQQGIGNHELGLEHPICLGDRAWSVFFQVAESKMPNLLGWAFCLILMAPRPGLEPGTYGLTVRARWHFSGLNGIFEKLYNQYKSTY